MKLQLIEETQSACIAPGMPGTEDNRYGMEGGLVHEHDDLYALYYTAFDYEEPQPREQPLYHYGFGRLGRLLVRVS